MYLKAKRRDPYGHRLYKKRFLTKKRLPFFLIALAGALLLAAGVLFFVIYNEGDIAAWNAQKLLNEYEQNRNTATARMKEPTAEELPDEAAFVTAVPATTLPAMEPVEGYRVIGKLIIDRIGQQLPVIAETTTAALKVSCCYYQGPLPGQAGNMVITGHDYASGAIFGKLSALKNGDIVVLSTPAKDYTYEVYDTKVIKPNDADALKEYKGDTALTLMTCMNHGNNRLLVMCTSVR